MAKATGIWSARRRALRNVALLIALALGWWGVYSWLHPRLRPVTVLSLPVGTQFLFSVNGAGFPMMQATPTKPYTAPSPIAISQIYRPNPSKMHWLGDDGRPTGAPLEWGWNIEAIPWMASPHLYVSPLREVAVWGGDGMATLFWRDGRRQAVMPDRYRASCMPNGAGYFHAYGTLHDAQGKQVPLPPGYFPADFPGVCSADPRYLIVRKGQYTLGVFDLQARKLVTSQPFQPFSPGMLFHHGDRFLLVSVNGAARVIERGKVIYAMRPGATPWQWSEDGTVWQVNGYIKQAKVLHWRQGPCALAWLPVTVEADVRVHAWGGEPGTPRGGFPGGYPGGFIGVAMLPTAASLAVWDDGRLIARTDTYRMLRPGTAGKLQAVAGALRLRGAIASEARRLTLYRDGKPVGSYRLPLNAEVLQSPPSLATLGGGFRNLTIYGSTAIVTTLTGKTITYDLNGGCREHLAFTGDGQYLSWLLYTGKDVKHLVFRCR